MLAYAQLASPPTSIFSRAFWTRATRAFCKPATLPCFFPQSHHIDRHVDRGRLRILRHFSSAAAAAKPSKLRALVQLSCGPLMTMLRKSVTIKSRGPADFFSHLAVIVSSNLPNIFEVRSCHVTSTIRQDSAYTSLLVSFHSWFLSIG